MLEVNNARCVPPLDGTAVAQMTTHITADYAHLRGVDAEDKGAARFTALLIPSAAD